MDSPKQAHGGNSTPCAVKPASGFKTNVPLNTGHVTPAPSAKLKPKMYVQAPALFTRSGN